MGGNGQAMFHLQVLTNLLDYGMDPQEAIERPRFLIGAFLPDDPSDITRLEGRVPRRVVTALERRGHHLRVESDFLHTGWATRTPSSSATGTLMGGADPRGDGVALGF